MITKIDQSKSWYFKKENFNEKDLILNNYEGFFKFEHQENHRKLVRGKYLFKKSLEINDLSKTYYLVFEGVIEPLKLFVNGLYVVFEKGLTIKNKVDVSKYLKEGLNEISIILDDFNPNINIPNCCYFEVYPKKHIIEHYFYYDKTRWYLDLHSTPDFDGKIRVVLKGESELINREFDSHDVSEFLPKLKLWSPKSPNLYDLEISLLQNEKVIDKVEQKVGFRYFEYKDGKYYLNDQLIEEIIYINLDEHDDEFLNHCDEEGKVVIENIIYDKWLDQEIMIENAANLIVSSRHHSSICAWKVSNINDDIEKIIKVLVNLIDPTRMIIK